MTIYLNEIKIDRPSFLGGGYWILKNLTDINIIFGKNGSGKSLLLRKIRDDDNKIFHYLSPERSGDIKYDVGIANDELSPKNRANRRKQNLSPTFRQEAISRVQSVLTKIGGVAGRGRVHSIHLKDIEELLETLLTDFDFKILTESPYFSIKRKKMVRM